MGAPFSPAEIPGTKRKKPKTKNKQKNIQKNLFLTKKKLKWLMLHDVPKKNLNE
jgi:hypothetical protein